LCKKHKICGVLFGINLNYEKKAPCILIAGYEVSGNSANNVSVLEAADIMLL
jgi:hypothetical protein